MFSKLKYILFATIVSKILFHSLFSLLHVDIYSMTTLCFNQMPAGISTGTLMIKHLKSESGREVNDEVCTSFDQVWCMGRQERGTYLT